MFVGFYFYFSFKSTTFKKEDLFLYCVIYGAGDRVELLEAVFL